MTPEPVLDDLSRILNTPLVQLGELAITPMFFIKVALFAAVLLVTSAVIRRRVVIRVLERAQVDEGTRYAMARISSYVVWIVGVIIGLPLLGVQLSSLTVALGTIGIGIGLGLQKIAENFISGLILLFGRPIKVGDRIKVGDVVGSVVEIQSRVTMVRTNDNIIKLVPNANLISEEVTNLTHNDRVVRFHFPVGVSYESDPNHVRDVLLSVARSHQAILDEPAPDVVFRGFGDSSLDFELRAFTSQMVHVPEVLTSEVNFMIWYALAEAGITIPFPQRDLHIRSLTPEVARIARTG